MGKRLDPQVGEAATVLRRALPAPPAGVRGAARAALLSGQRDPVACVPARCATDSPSILFLQGKPRHALDVLVATCPALCNHHAYVTHWITGLLLAAAAAHSG